MSYLHKELAAGRWQKLPLVEQMANIGSEVERAINWKLRQRPVYAKQAFERSLELIDLTLDSVKGFARIKEIARLREALVDYFFGDNTFASTAESWKRYFSHFTYAVRKNY